MSWLSSLLSSLPFANAAMLLWGLAAGLPVVIHLLSRRKHRPMAWAAMTFLLAAVRKNARRLRIEQMTLLLIRTAILVLLAIALADPVFSLFPPRGIPQGRGERTHYLLVLDVSYSMDCREGERSRLDHAKELAAQLVRESRLGDGFTLVLLSDAPQIAIADPAFDPRDALDEIESVRVRHGGANLSLTLAQVENVMQSVQRQHPQLAATRICFFTDLQRATWDDVSGENVRRVIARLAQHARLSLVDVASEDVANLAVTALDLRESAVTVGREATFTAEIQAFGTRDRIRTRAAWVVDDQQVRAESINVSAAGRTSVSFTHAFDSPGEHQVEVRLADDALALDNRRWLSVPVRDALRVLCIEGRPGAARFVAYALEPSDDAAPRVRPVIHAENALLEQDLRRFECVVLSNVRRFTRDEAAVLGRYVRGGGGLIVTLGDQTQADNYNQMLVDQAAIRVLPARLLRVADTAEYTFAPLEYRHPIVAPFAGHERSGLLTTPIWKYWRVERLDASRVALAYNTGDPAIIDETFRRGRTILLTTAASPDCLDRTTDPPTPWTALATWPSFPPLVQEMLADAVRGQIQTRNVLVGEPLEGTLPGPASGGTALTIQMPGGESARVPLRTTSDGDTWSFTETAASGMYVAAAGTAAETSQRYAVNLRPRESDLSRLDSTLLPGEFEPQSPRAAAASESAAPQPTQYYRYFLAMILVLLLSETTLAWHFGSAAA